MSTAQGGALVTFDTRKHVLSAASVTFPPTSSKGLGKKSREHRLFCSPFSPPDLAAEFVGPSRRIPEAVLTYIALIFFWRIHRSADVANPRSPFLGRPQNNTFFTQRLRRRPVRAPWPTRRRIRAPAPFPFWLRSNGSRTRTPLLQTTPLGVAPPITAPSHRRFFRIRSALFLLLVIP